MNQGKWEVVKQETARVNVDILGISELKWTGMGAFNLDYHYICYWFCIHSASLCLLVGPFNPFTFKIIIDKYDPVSIYFIVLGLSLYTLFVFPV